MDTYVKSIATVENDYDTYDQPTSPVGAAAVVVGLGSPVGPAVGGYTEESALLGTEGTTLSGMSPPAVKGGGGGGGGLGGAAGGVGRGVPPGGTASLVGGSGGVGGIGIGGGGVGGTRSLGVHPEANTHRRHPLLRALSSVRHGSTAAGLTAISLFLRLLSLILLFAALGLGLWLQVVAFMQLGLYNGVPLGMAALYVPLLLASAVVREAIRVYGVDASGVRPAGGGLWVTAAYVGGVLGVAAIVAVPVGLRMSHQLARRHMWTSLGGSGIFVLGVVLSELLYVGGAAAKRGAVAEYAARLEPEQTNEYAYV
ncbi:hypothetical protein MMPV_004305 [Pyropia vietnamensis]